MSFMKYAMKQKVKGSRFKLSTPFKHAHSLQMKEEVSNDYFNYNCINIVNLNIMSKLLLNNFSRLREMLELKE